MSRSKLSTVRLTSKADFSKSQLNSALIEIEQGLRSIESAHDIGPSKSEEPLKIENKNQAVIAYGRLITQFAEILRSSNLNSLSELLRLDHQYLSAEADSTMESCVSAMNLEENFADILAQILELERWIGD